MTRPHSIPLDAEEREVCAYRKEEHPSGGGCEWPRRVECFVAGRYVGFRDYDGESRITGEVPELRQGCRHGIAYDFHESGQVSLAEPFHNGQIHGVARQYDHDGVLMGTYEHEHGTGYDIWRQGPYDDEDEIQAITVSEIWSRRGGQLHGFNWWLNLDQQSVHEEVHFQDSQFHGIERRWQIDRHPQHLEQGFPKFWICGNEVTRQEYLKRAASDLSLPPYRKQDDLPQRTFPPEVIEAIKRGTVA